MDSFCISFTWLDGVGLGHFNSSWDSHHSSWSCTSSLSCPIQIIPHYQSSHLLSNDYYCNSPLHSCCDFEFVCHCLHSAVSVAIRLWYSEEWFLAVNAEWVWVLCLPIWVLLLSPDCVCYVCPAWSSLHSVCRSLHIPHISLEWTSIYSESWSTSQCVFW